eukprot:s3864_g4.t1
MWTVPGVKPEDKIINKVSATFIKDSFDEHAKSMLNDMNFLKNLKRFAEHSRDSINDETCELIEPYIRFDPDPVKNWGPWKHAVLDQSLAKKANAAAEGLCKFVGAMVMYHEASKIVKPKMDYLKVQEAKLDKARAELAEAEAELHKVQSEVAELDRQLQAAFHAKAELEANKEAQKRKTEAANRLLKGLETEQDRWTEDAATFASRRLKLVGDVALAGGFVTYCGPFNSEFRDKITQENFMQDIRQLKVPANNRVNMVEFLVDEGTVGEWSLDGLPSDELSIQNAIMVTRSSRYPLMVDPQGQALAWIKNKEHERIAREPNMCVTTLQNRILKDTWGCHQHGISWTFMDDQLECTISHGLCLIIENVENEMDPMLDPVLEKAVVMKATSKKMVLRVGDTNVEYDERFCLYMTSRLPNPHFSPELSAKTTVIDFTVTLRGAPGELGRVLNMEQKALEEMLVALKEDATNNTKALQGLGQLLLVRDLRFFTQHLVGRSLRSLGFWQDDQELIEVLANTKAKAKEVEGKLDEARQRTLEIDEKREQFRSVATRGSLMRLGNGFSEETLVDLGGFSVFQYVGISAFDTLFPKWTDMVLVTNPITLQPSGWMYSCSLNQFLEQFDYSVKHSDKVQPTSKRVDKIIDFLTYQVYRYMNRGLFERDKMMFKPFTLAEKTVGKMAAFHEWL